jgi:hypothetical protein
MVQWAGATPAHITWLPRKPTPLGFLLWTAVDATAGVLLNAEICEGKNIDSKKPYYETLGHKAAVTRRMMEPFSNDGVTAVCDAWFGSVKAAVTLSQIGVFSVLNVKTNTKGFIKDKLLSECT